MKKKREAFWEHNQFAEAIADNRKLCALKEQKHLYQGSQWLAFKIRQFAKEAFSIFSSEKNIRLIGVS